MSRVNAELDCEKEDSVWRNGVRGTVQDALRSLNVDEPSRGQRPFFSSCSNSARIFHFASKETVKAGASQGQAAEDPCAYFTRLTPVTTEPGDHRSKLERGLMR